MSGFVLSGWVCYSLVCFLSGFSENMKTVLAAFPGLLLIVFTDNVTNVRDRVTSVNGRKTVQRKRSL